MSDAAPPPWAKRAPGLGAAHKFLLLVLWGYGPFKRTGPEEHDGDRQPGRPVVVWASRQTLAEATDQPVSTVKKQLARLASDGWIRRVTNGSKTVLAWRDPHAFDYGWTADGPRGSTSGPAHERAEGVHERAEGVHERATGWTTSGPQSSIDLPIDLPTELEDDAHGREALDKCGLCTVDIGGTTWRRRIHADCTTHQDISFLGALDVVTPEELTHGDTPGKIDGTSGEPDRRRASPGDRRGAGEDGKGEGGQGGATAGAGGCRDQGLAGGSRPRHVEASLARARGSCAAPRRDHDLTDELWAVVIAGGWSPEAEHPMFRQALLETVRDKGLAAADLAQIFARYQLSSPMLRPDRSRLFYTRGKLGRRARDFLDRALDREANPKGGAAWAMDGGLHVVGGAS